MCDIDFVRIDGDKAIKRFHETKKEWGFAQQLPLGTFKKSCNGLDIYLVVNHYCVLWAGGCRNRQGKCLA